MPDVDVRHLGCGRAQVLGEGARDEVACAVMHQFFVERSAEAVRKAAVDLTLDDQRVQHGADVVHRNVFHDLDAACGAVDLDRCEVGDEPVGHGRRNTVVLAGAGQRRGIEHEGLGHAGAHAAGHAGRVPVRARREAPHADRALRVRLQARCAARELHRIGSNIEILGRHLLQLVAELARAALHGTGDRRGKAVGIVARGDGPRDVARVGLGQHIHVLGRHAKLVGDDLRRDGGVPLPVGRAVELHGDPAARVDGNRDRGIRAGLGL